MSDFSLQATSRTPAIHLNTADMTLVISGESYPEDVRQFYTTINEQLAVYFTTKPERLDVAIKLTYFNSGSARALMELLDQLDEAAEKGVKIIVNWYCAPDDDITQEFAEDIGANIRATSVNILDLDGDPD